MNHLQVSNHWRTRQEGRSLEVIGGQDAIYSIELETDETSFFASPPKTFSFDDLSKPDQDICEQLLSAQIVHPMLELEKSKPIGAFVSGDQVAVDQFIEEFPFVESSEADLVILVRATNSFTDFLSDVRYNAITKPHLFVDLAYHHTVSFGPLVFPKQTSCVSCLKGRITNRWDHDSPPENPLSLSRNIAFAREWTRLEITKLVEDENYHLVNKTISIDTNSMTALHNKLLTLPMCEYCKR